jgi:moderate conductance mechanosensitive channel
MQAAEPDPALLDACGDKPSAVCKWVWERTGNEALSTVVDWLIGRPLEALVILLVTWLASWVARRMIRRAIFRVVLADRTTAARALEKVVPAKGLVTIEDPRRSARATSIATVVSSTVSVGIWVVGILLALGQLGLDLAPLIAGAGIAGIALGFGAQNLVKDCITGLFMLIEDQYGIGDVVDLGVASGNVERVTLRTTVLRSQDGTVWHVPNGEIRRVGNRTKLWSVAVLDITVAYDADLVTTREVVQRVAEEVVEDDRYEVDVLAAPEVLGVESVAPDGVVLRLLVRTNPGAQFRLQRALREAIKAALDEAGVAVLPPPSREAPVPAEAGDSSGDDDAGAPS